FLLLRFRYRHNLALYLVSYGVFRFFIEYLRGDYRGSFIAGISPSQFWSILMVAAGVGVYFLCRFCLYPRRDAALAKAKEAESDQPPAPDAPSAD
ncbi:MAG: prolipoprotein diacylglyceryl transferase, partial [Clostridia bacterium]|nr:prolipoprotein diacylglyceryl transferase [Clostridia bacterium]